MKRRIFSMMLRAALLLCPKIDIGHARAEVDATAACPTFPPVKTLVLLPIYRDAKSSIPDEDAVRTNAEVTSGVTNLLRFAANALDDPKANPAHAPAACAFENFLQWAGAGALTAEPYPYNREGKVKRGEFDIAISILALKFEARGFALDPGIRAWIHTLNSENLSFWEKASNRGNLRVWAAAGAALDALLTGDSAAAQFQNQVWQEAIAAIRDDGTIAAELSRGQRALIYHNFSFQATLVLRAARAALGYEETSKDHARLARLADGIGRALCRPEDLARVAGAIQEMPGDWFYRIPIGFGSDLLSEDWRRCGNLQSDLFDPATGGDTRYSAEVLMRIAHDSSGRRQH